MSKSAIPLGAVVSGHANRGKYAPVCAAMGIPAVVTLDGAPFVDCPATVVLVPV